MRSTHSSSKGLSRLAIAGAKIGSQKNEVRLHSQKDATDAKQQQFHREQMSLAQTMISQQKNEYDALRDAANKVAKRLEEELVKTKKLEAENKELKNEVEKLHQQRIGSLPPKLLFPKLPLQYKANPIHTFSPHETFTDMKLLHHGNRRICATSNKIGIWDFAKKSPLPEWEYDMKGCLQLEVHPYGHVFARNHLKDVYLFKKEKDTFSNEVPILSPADDFIIDQNQNIVLISMSREKIYEAQVWSISLQGDLNSEGWLDLSGWNGHRFVGNIRDYIITRDSNTNSINFWRMNPSSSEITKVLEKRIGEHDSVHCRGNFIFIGHHAFDVYIFDVATNDFIKFPFDFKYHIVKTGCVLPDGQTYVLGLEGEAKFTEFFMFNSVNGLKYATGIKGIVHSFLMHESGEFSISLEDPRTHQQSVVTYECQHLKDLMKHLVLPELMETVTCQFQMQDISKKQTVPLPKDLAENVVGYLGSDIQAPRNLYAFFQEKTAKIHSQCEVKYQPATLGKKA